MEERIIEIIEELTEFKDLKKQKDIDLIENEILDSLAFIELIEMLENEYGVEIQPTQVPSDTWRKIKNISKLIKSLQ